MKLDYEPEKLNEEVRNSLPNLILILNVCLKIWCLWVCFLSLGSREGVRGDALKTAGVQLLGLVLSTEQQVSGAQQPRLRISSGVLATARTRAFGQVEGPTDAQESRVLFLVFGLLARRARQCTEDLRVSA